MKALNFTISSKTIFIVSILVLTIATSGLLLPQVIAEHGETGITKPLVANSLPQSLTLTTDFSTIESDLSFTITVEEPDANLDSSAIDVTQNATAFSDTSFPVNATTIMTETGPDTGIFTGTIQVSEEGPTAGNVLQISNDDVVTASYVPESIGVGRLSAVLNVINPGGGVKISDNLINLDEFQVNVDWRPVTHPVKIELLGGATLDVANPPVITISYANAIFKSGDSPGLLNMYYRHGEVVVPGFGTFPGSGWTKIRDFGIADPASIDTDAMTITSDVANTQFGQLGNKIFFLTGIFQASDAEFALGIQQGIGGGGGGGLVRQGLVVNALAGVGAIFGSSGGGGGGPPGPTITLGAIAKYDSASETISLPQEIRDIVINHDPYTPLDPIGDIYVEFDLLEPITESYEDFDLPLTINGNGFALGGYENTLVTQTVDRGEPIEFTIVFYTGSEIAHTSLYFNLGPTRTIAGSDTQVLLYKDKPVEIIDPNGNILSATGTINNEGDLKRVVTFSITFSEDIQWSNSDLVIRSWNDNLNSGDTIVYDAIEILPSEEEIAFVESLPEPVVEQLKSQYVPIWIKNNAGWWSQQLIDDSDFVAGIEYLTQNRIITVQDNQISADISYEQIPLWIKNNAGWWSEDLITEKEFVDGLQWLISNGIIQVVEI